MFFYIPAVFPLLASTPGTFYSVGLFISIFPLVCLITVSTVLEEVIVWIGLDFGLGTESGELKDVWRF